MKTRVCVSDGLSMSHGPFVCGNNKFKYDTWLPSNYGGNVGPGTIYWSEGA